jgi:hypothetical protein
MYSSLSSAVPFHPPNAYDVKTLIFCAYKFHLWVVIKAVPLQAWGGPEGSRKLRFPDFLTTAQDGGKVVSLSIPVTGLD